MSAIAKVLRSRRAPTVELVMQELLSNTEFDGQHSSNYLSNGGKIEHAIAAVL
jgi:hypothetical protein